MSLEISKLENVRSRGKKINARCPACAESGHDRRGEHLVIDADGRFACVVYPGHSPDAKAHRKRIFRLSGSRDVKPLYVRPARETDDIGRLGREFQIHLEASRKIEKDAFPAEGRCDNQRGVLAVLQPAVRPNRPLTERELCLLQRAGAENDPIIIMALKLFNGAIVE